MDGTKEQRILRVMRQVLGSIVRETTPTGGTKHPLSDKTIEDIRQCFGLIAAREKELADEHNLTPERPYFTDEPPSTKVVPITRIGKRDSGNEDD